MGDRANVIIKDGGSTVYLYTHWRGRELPATVAAALARGQDRFDDGPYLARIIFCEMVKNEGDGCLDGTTGLGISSVRGDGGDSPDITINVADQTIQFGNQEARPL